ncbi:MAG: membrane protein insertase YidC [Paludibacteraceae bacterium]|nr:membrane protein insertase YidC [Paludibacteraceae bacterium]
MDKNTIIGFSLIAVIIIGFSFFNRPSKEELERRQHYRDSVQLVRMAAEEAQRASQLAEAVLQDSVSADSEQLQQSLQETFGVFAPFTGQETQTTIVENELLTLRFSNKGGRVSEVLLKKYTAYNDSLPLSLFDDNEQTLNFTIITQNNRILSTKDLFFTPQEVVMQADSSQQLTMRLQPTEDAYMDFVYTIRPNSYLVDMSIVAHNMQTVLAPNQRSLETLWEQWIPQQENGRKFEERYATLDYMFTDQDVEKLSESKKDEKRVSNRLRWIAYKDQFFSTVFIADDAFTSTELFSEPLHKNSGYVKHYRTKTSVGFDPTGAEATNLHWYFGPNHYNTLKSLNTGVEKAERWNLQELVPLGWKIVAWINRILVIPMFDLFSSWGMHIGWVILLMTLVIKLIILPFTFTSYRSTAKMRVLKPQIDAINEKYPPEKMQERQQATMALYQKAGVSPLSGCLPMLFQFPVLMAMFWFFPTAIELRGQSLFWAEDLSTYDAIITWTANIPFISWFFGNHISLFCLLMTIANLGYTVINMQSQATDPNMKFMKWMMYLMPVFFMYIFNDYAAGLSYYYLLSLAFTIIQTYIFRWSINDEKLLEEMKRKQAKNAKKQPSGFMARLEKMQREQQRQMRERINQGKR